MKLNRIIKKCEECNHSFVTSSIAAKYCSIKCRQKNADRNVKKRRTLKLGDKRNHPVPVKIARKAKYNRQNIERLS